ncbi:hypothetical protein [Halomonas colorata]|uniref:hypothetical protein n=1 Tax=Halomonas colorata TaxID=2742615 RepID=UPI0018694633|nr:hypothetical protein [Halomonas colorata]
MSLESQVSALVSAASKLTSEIAGKMKGIDNTLSAAQRKFDEFTGKDFPKRVSEARSIKVFLDTAKGNDENTGLSASNPVKTYRQVSRVIGGGDTIYDIVELTVAGGSAVILDGALYAKSEIRIVCQDGPVGGVTKLIQGFYGGSAAGRPMQPFRAPYVEIDDKTNGNVELHTAEFKDGHTWEEATGKNTAWMCYVGSMLENTPRFKLRNVDVKLHDIPLSMVYMGGSMGSFSTYQIIIGASCDFSVEPAGGSSASFTNSPRLLYCYDNPKIPLDIIASTLTISGNITSVSQLFGNLNTQNVRSSFTI